MSVLIARVCVLRKFELHLNSCMEKHHVLVILNGSVSVGVISVVVMIQLCFI